jgi:hypothetical protein
VNKLLQYLDESGWTKTEAGTRRIEKGGWIYDWQAGIAWTDLWRWHPGRTGEGEVETFIIQSEARCIEVARKINAGEHPNSPEPDPKSGRRSVFL